jgi:branched-chain amino acid transport system permease protein
MSARVATSLPVRVLRLTAGLVLVLVLITVVFDGASTSLQTTVVRGLILMTATVGLYVFMGTSGVVSFGHVSFAAVGAYLSGILMVNPAIKLLQQPDLPEFLQRAELGAVTATLLGGAAGAVLALLIVGPVVRLSGLAAGLATFSILVIVRVVIQNWDAVTRGTTGYNNVPSDAVAQPLQVLPWALLAILVAAVFQCSGSGLRLRASREDEVAARAVGIRVGAERGVAFVLSGFVFGIAGALYGQFLGTFGPDAFYLGLTFQVLSMLIIGGMTSLFGAVAGAGVVTALTEVLQRAEGGIDLGPLQTGAIANLSDFGLALATLVILIVRPRGLTGGRELSVPVSRRRPAGVPAGRPGGAAVSGTEAAVDTGAASAGAAEPRP